MNNTPDSVANTCTINKYIGSDFDYIIAVAEYLEDIIKISNISEAILNITPNIPVLSEISDNLHNIVNAGKNINEILEIHKNITESELNISKIFEKTTLIHSEVESFKKSTKEYLNDSINNKKVIESLKITVDSNTLICSEKSEEIIEIINTEKDNLSSLNAISSSNVIKAKEAANSSEYFANESKKSAAIADEGTVFLTETVLIPLTEKPKVEYFKDKKTFRFYMQDLAYNTVKI